MTKCLTAKKVKVAEFNRNEKNAEIYDIENRADDFPFTYFRLTRPRQGFLIAQGASFVAESFKKDKVLFTGLRHYGRGIYVGNVIGSDKKRNLLLFRHTSETHFTLFLFNGNPRNIRQIINEIERG